MGLIRKQLILVGDASCGKSALALRLSHALFADSYIPTSFESHSAVIDTDEGSMKLVLQDTTGGVDGKELRKLAYNGCHGVLVCFDLTNASSYHSIETRWIPEIQTMVPGMPVYIAGCKKDLVEKNTDDKCVSEQQAIELAQKVGAAGYLECSALTDENVDKIFKELAEAKTQKQKSNIRRAISGQIKSLKKIL